MENIENLITVYENIISVLIRLDEESKMPNITAEEFGRRGIAITRILNKVEEDFGTEIMMKIFALTNARLGRTLGPLDVKFVQRLVKCGVQITNIGRMVEFDKRLL